MMKVAVITLCLMAGVVIGSPGVGECKDLVSICSDLTTYCDDPGYSQWMETYCQASCGYCGPPIEPEPPVPATDAPVVPQTDAPVVPPTDAPVVKPKVRSSIKGCGRPQIQGIRVIAGKDAVRGSWPWQILMLWNSQASCGGSLVSPNWVVTAAHCVYGDENTPSIFSVKTGEYDRDVIEGSEKVYQVEKVIVHPGYNPNVLNNDIALLKLSAPVAFNKFVSPICLPEVGAEPGTECFITGWGKTNHTGHMTRILQQGLLPVVSQQTCNKLNKENIGIPVTEAMICGGNGGKTKLSGCHGDSGGPYVCKRGDGAWELQGAVSHGSSVCDSKETYTVFAKVAYFRDWIDTNMSTE